MHKSISLTTLISAFFATVNAYAMGTTPIIRDASYLVYEGDQGTTGGVPATSRLVTFYTFNGDPLATLEHHFSFPVMSRKLDPCAPKPQPVTYAIRYWPAISIGLFGKTKGTPGNLILFFDKHGNTIDRGRFVEGRGLEAFSDKLDLSVVKQREDV